MGKISNFRFSDEVLAAIESLKERWECKTQVEVVSKAILSQWVGPSEAMVPNEVATGLQAAQINRIEDSVLEFPVVVERMIRTVSAELRANRMVNGSGAAQVAPTSATVPSTARFAIQCLHCGHQGRGSTKFATICFDCKSCGHTGDTRECPKCRDQGTGAL